MHVYICMRTNDVVLQYASYIGYTPVVGSMVAAGRAKHRLHDCGSSEGICGGVSHCMYVCNYAMYVLHVLLCVLDDA